MSKKFLGALNRSRNTIPNIKNEIIEKKEEIIFNLDISELELEINEIEDLKTISKEIRFYKEETNKVLSKISESLYKAQKIFANKKNGLFEKYLLSEGIDKSFAYRLLRRYNLFLEYKQENIFEIGIKPIDIISKFKEKLTKEQIIEIINSENPTAILRELGLLDKKPKDEIIDYSEFNYIDDIKEKINNFEKEKDKKKFIRNEMKNKKDLVKELTEKLKIEKAKLKQLKEMKNEI